MTNFLQTILVKMFATIAGAAAAASIFFNPAHVDAPMPVQQSANIEIATTTSHIDAPVKEVVIIAAKKQPSPTPSAQIVPAQQPSQVVTPNVESWINLENKYFAEGNQKGWSTLVITNGLSEKRYYLKVNSAWIQKNSEEELQTLNTNSCNGKNWSPCPTGERSYCPSTGEAQCLKNVAPITNELQQIDFNRPPEAPSIEQMRRLVAMCNLNEELAKNCGTNTFISGYMTSSAFRILIDDLANQAIAFITAQQAKDDLNRERYSLYMQTINQPPISSAAHYESYSIPVYSGGLLEKYPALMTTPIKWDISWTGGGAGTVVQYSGGVRTQTQFQCVSGRCFSL